MAESLKEGPATRSERIGGDPPDPVYAKLTRPMRSESQGSPASGFIVAIVIFINKLLGSIIGQLLLNSGLCRPAAGALFWAPITFPLDTKWSD